MASMTPVTKLWSNNNWVIFSEKVKKRDGYQCSHCNRSPPDVVLQVHHEFYIPDKLPWEYSLSDCTTLCKGCHAREHGIIEPTTGWTLVNIFDLGELSGICEKDGCGNQIRYEHNTYHPQWGYKTVGSTCVDYLTEEDVRLSESILKTYKKISNFVHSSQWDTGFTKHKKKYIESIYNRSHKIRVYGSDNAYAFQICLRNKGSRSYDYRKPIPIKNKPLEQVKELAFITLKGMTTDNEENKQRWRELYKNLR